MRMSKAVVGWSVKETLKSPRISGGVLINMCPSLGYEDSPGLQTFAGRNGVHLNSASLKTEHA